jgi:dipeptidyl aminopeptidase/acylaminoacyl peptidase
MVTHQFFDSVKLGSMVWLNSIEVSADGSRILLSSTRRDVVKNRLSDDIYILSETGDQLHHFTGSSPILSPDGRYIAFEEDGGLSVYNLQSKQSRKLTNIYSTDYFMGHMAESNFMWSPDSKSIAYISSDPHETQPSSQQATSRLLYKTKGGRGREKFVDERLMHIWKVSIETAETYCLTPGNFNEHSITWSPDGNHIAFISDRSGNPDRTHSNDLLTVNVHTKELKTVVTGRGSRFKPKWSPRGDVIAFLADGSAFTSKDSAAPDMQVYCVTPDGKELKCLTASLDRRTDNIKWGIVGDRIYFTAGDHGSTSLYSVNISDTTIAKAIDGRFQVKDYSVFNTGDRVAFIKNTIDAPDELYIAALNGATCNRITTFNDAVSTAALVGAETFWFNASDNTPVQGWLMKPSEFRASSKCPVVLVIHGGPHNMYGYEFDEKMQWLCAKGYGVVFFNPRGSHGYGQQFTNGNLLNWGGRDYEDIMNGMQYVLANYAWIDKHRLGVTGQSYGGFMTNWIITQTNLFKAAVSDGGISNLISFAGTSLYHCLIEAEFNGDTWNNYDLLWRWSPLKYVKNVTTPTLFLHGEKDNEVPVTQAEEMFSALKRLGVESEFVQYMNEGHGWRPDLLPANRIDLYGRMTDWFDNYLKPKDQL